jgi:hypothetical protein
MKRKSAIWVAAVVCLAFVGWGVSRMWGRTPRPPRIQAKLTQDIVFAVTGTAFRPAGGGKEMYTVDLCIANKAKGADYTFKPDDVAVTDDRSGLLQLLSFSCWGSSTLHPGEDREFALILEGPPGAKSLHVAFNRLSPTVGAASAPKTVDVRIAH